MCDPDIVAMSGRARELAERLRWRLVVAAATPMTANRRVDDGAARGYLRRLVEDGAEGLAVGVHTGRGSVLQIPERCALLRAARSLDVPVVAGTGSAAQADELAWVRAASEAGADVLLVSTPGNGSRMAPAEDVIAHHDTIWKASGLPLLAFDLYSRPYPADVLDAVLQHPGVLGYKPARLHDAVAVQEGIAIATANDRLVLSGEDRMLGPSLTWGAQGCLIGAAAAAVGVTLDVLRSWREGDYVTFVRASQAFDVLARAVFRPPYDGYVQRMLWVASDQGMLPEHLAHDPCSPKDLDPGERTEVLAVVRRLLQDRGSAVLSPLLPAGEETAVRAR